MYNVLIIDDEPGARSALKELLALFCPEIDSIAEASSGAEALQIVKQQTIDVVFVDIQLKRINGIQLAKRLITYCENLIFVTAHDQYALQAFEANALHYLLKPVDPTLLQNALKRVKSKHLVPSENRNGKLILHMRGGMVILNHEEIFYLQGEGNYCTFYCQQEQQYLVSKNLSYYEDLLSSERFFRIHQSYLINVEHVRQVITQNGCSVILKTDEKLPVARRRKDALLRILA